jgi:hypothetical protein
MKTRDILCNVGGFLLAMVWVLSILAVVVGVGLALLVGMERVGILSYFLGLVLAIGLGAIAFMVWEVWGQDLAQKCKDYWNEFGE